jgi:ribonuclease R
MWIDADGALKKHRFHRAMMHSAARLTYNPPAARHDGAPDDELAPLMDSVVKPLYGAYRVLLAAREKRGALDLDLPERLVSLGDDGRIAEIGVRERLDSHKLIEEFMVLANVAGRPGARAAPLPLPLPRPRPARRGQARSAARVPRHARHRRPGRPAPAPGRPQPRAARHRGQADGAAGQRDRPAQPEPGGLQPEQSRPFRLALARYAHFTSPIRRFPDLIVHRALISAYGLGDGGLPHEDKSRFEEFGEHLSMCERRAVAAERSAMDRYVAAYMADHVGATFAGRVTSVTRFGLFMSLDGTGADGTDPDPQPRPGILPSRRRPQMLVGERTGETYGLGDRLKVKLDQADTATGGLLFDVVEVIERVERQAPSRGNRLSERRGPRRPVAHGNASRDKRSRRRN